MKNSTLFNSAIAAKLPRLVYCANDTNLPPMGMQVNAFCRKPGTGRRHTTLIEAYWMAEYGKPVWYVGDTRINVPVVAWIYIPVDYTITNEKLFQLAKLGDMPL